MSDRAALYAAVCANPDEDTPRLVLADWLEEHGEAKRAAFIRAKIDLHNREEVADTDARYLYPILEYESGDLRALDWSKIDPELAALFAANKAVDRHAIKLTPKTEGIPKLKGIQVEGNVRGFLQSVIAIDGADFLKHADAIFRHAPITSVTFNDLDPDDARDIVKRGLLARIRNLTIWGMDEPEALTILGNHPDAASVRSLSIDGTNEASDADVIAALIGGKHWTGLRKLNLNEMGEEGLVFGAQETRLFRKPAFAGLRALVAYDCHLSDLTAKALAAGGLPELRYLDLGINEITADGAAAIAKSKSLTHLRYLDLGSNDIDDGVATAALINSAKLPKLAVLRLSGLIAGAAPAPKVLAKPGRGPGLRALELNNMLLDAHSIAAMAASPALGGLWWLSLNNCALPAADVAPLFKSPQFNRLAYLDLRDNKLNAKAAQAIANWPGAASLQWLGLSDNPLTSDGLGALADSPNLAGLKFLSVSGAATSKGFKKLKKRFGKALERSN